MIRYLIRLVIAVLLITNLFCGKPITQKETFVGNNTTDYNSINDDVIALLIIPKIKLKKDLYRIESDMNSVNRTVQIIKPSNMPDEINGNLILAAHSGNSRIAYFKHLDLLNKGDYAMIEYLNVNYIYQLANIYSVKKTGSIEIIRNYNKNVLTLITCDKHNKDRQLVFIFELTKKENLSEK